MSSTLQSASVAEVLARLEADLDELITLTLTSGTDAELMQAWQALERIGNKLPVAQYGFIDQARVRSLASTVGASSLAVAMRDLLHITPGEAASRIAAASSMGPTTGLLGEVHPPIYAGVAAAQTSGTISPASARVIVKTIEHLPPDARAQHDLALEKTLVAAAETLDVRGVEKVAQRATDLLNPDGSWKDVKARERNRNLRLWVNTDGSSRVEGELTAECTEYLRTVLDSLARPRPAEDGCRDSRSTGQRLHDGLTEAMRLLVRADLVPDCGGVSTTVVIHLTDQAWTTGKGTATTGHGATIPAQEAVRWANNARVMTLAKGSLKDVTEYSNFARTFTEGARLAMQARDRGCSFPGCDAPPAWTEAHHVKEWAQGGRTCIDNGCLLCGYHHRSFEQNGWSVAIVDGLPTWTPPEWHDPAQTPIRNHAHDPGDLFDLSGFVNPETGDPANSETDDE